MPLPHVPPLGGYYWPVRNRARDGQVRLKGPKEQGIAIGKNAAQHDRSHGRQRLDNPRGILHRTGNAGQKGESAADHHQGTNDGQQQQRAFYNVVHRDGFSQILSFCAKNSFAYTRCHTLYRRLSVRLYSTIR